MSIQSCLFNAFANPRYCDPQGESFMWAIMEGMNRLDPYHKDWRPTKARKEHECVRGCEIRDGNLYFQGEIGLAWDAYLKLCASCMAMILYYKEVYKLPRYIYSHWDIANNKPVLEKE